MEIWKTFNENYEVSNLGNVRNKKTGKKKKPSMNSSGYYIFGSFLKGKRTNIYVHRAVMFSFKGKPKEGLVVNHKDGNKLNNNLNNLEYVTVRENSIHAIKSGLSKAPTERARGNNHWTRLYPDKVARGKNNGAVKHPDKIWRGSQCVSSKLNEEEVKEIRSLYSDGKSELELAEIYGVSRRNINNIVKRRTWRHVKWQTH